MYAPSAAGRLIRNGVKRSSTTVSAVLRVERAYYSARRVPLSYGSWYRSATTLTNQSKDDQTQTRSSHSGLGAALGTQFTHDRVNVELDSVLADLQFVRDSPV